jgi:hypothetical protein
MTAVTTRDGTRRRISETAFGYVPVAPLTSFSRLRTKTLRILSGVTKDRAHQQTSE